MKSLKILTLNDCCSSVCSKTLEQLDVNVDQLKEFISQNYYYEVNKTVGYDNGINMLMIGKPIMIKYDDKFAIIEYTNKNKIRKKSLNKFYESILFNKL